MATVDDLTAAVRKLSARVKELEGGSAQELVNEIVSNVDDRSQPTRTGFADACRESNLEHREQIEAKAIQELKETHLATPLQIRSFRERYVVTLGRSRVDEIINEYDPDGRR
jgi:hypothetical protein